MYELQKETKKKRTYRNTVTGTEITTSVIYTDKDGRAWWAFDDLLQIPHIRKMAASQITQLYGVGFTKKDMTEFVTSQKAILKSNDPEKYEKAFAGILSIESAVNNNLDPVKQELGLCSVYILAADERVDFFSSVQTAEKMELWSTDIDLQSFFLNWLSGGMNDFTRHYKAITTIASQLTRL